MKLYDANDVLRHQNLLKSCVRISGESSFVTEIGDLPVNHLTDSWAAHVTKHTKVPAVDAGCHLVYFCLPADLSLVVIYTSNHRFIYRGVCRLTTQLM